MAKKVGIDGLEEALTEILDEYQTEIARGTKECVTKVAKAGVKTLKSVSPKRSGEYAKSWSCKVEEKRLEAKATLYNKKSGMPHLLEHGHVSRNQTKKTFGRVPAYVHIKPVEEKIAEEFEKEIKIMID